MLQLILAPPGCGKSEEIRNMILQRHEQGMRGMVLIVPEQISFDTERSMLRLLGAKCTESVEVLSFSRFCDKFFEQYGCERDELNADTRFLDIGIDSLDVVEMMVEIEDKVGYEVELTERVETIGALAQFIEDYE